MSLKIIEGMTYKKVGTYISYLDGLYNSKFIY